MRDVRRDGLIEALLIAFTPPRGLPYPRVYPRSIHLPSTDPRRPYLAKHHASIFFPLRRPSPSTTLRPSLPSPSSSWLASRRAFHLHLMQRYSRCASSVFASLFLLSFSFSFSLSASFSFPLMHARARTRGSEGSFLLFCRGKQPRHYINALIGIVAQPETLGMRRERVSVQKREKKKKERRRRKEREKKRENRVSRG